MTEHLPGVLADAFVISTSEARRCIVQGGVRVNGVPVYDLDVELRRGDVIQLGKRREAEFYPGLPWRKPIE